MDRDLRGIDFISSEDTDRIERLKRDVRVPDENIGNVKINCLRMKIRRHEANDLAMRSGLGKHVPIAVQHIAQAHAVCIGQPARRVT